MTRALPWLSEMEEAQVMVEFQRLLIKRAERSGPSRSCPWCGAFEPHPHVETGPNGACQAFHPDGTPK